ncbi:MAG: hypothetical protein L0241_13180 [Planctomycetia bacterium]|nr:hypothetical protein [Planctomycetia bacterium]
MTSLSRLGVGLILSILTLGLAQADEPAKAEFKTTSMEALTKGGETFDWSDANFLGNLKGEDGWELLLTSNRAALFRKTKDSPKWEYKAVKAKNSPFATLGMKDMDAFALILDRMATDGYRPCAVSELGNYILFKRVKDAKPVKAEFQTLLWSDVIKSKVAPADRFKEKEFVETLNKQGGEGWEVCVCNIHAAVFQKSALKWEHKTVKVTKSPLTSNFDVDKDDEAATFTLILEGLEDKGWKPCACGSYGQEILLKRELKKDKKD